MAYDAASPEAQLGSLAESEAARLMAHRGHLVVPIFSATQNTDNADAPLLYRPRGGFVVGPDLLVFSAAGSTWVDVKAKTGPTWRRTHRRWEHGIDRACFEDYEAVGRFSHLPVWILILEEHAPIDSFRESELSGRSAWLTISLSDARQTGEERRDWPGGPASPARRGRHGLGGWLWPRNAMRPWLAGGSAPGGDGEVAAHPETCHATTPG